MPNSFENPISSLEHLLDHQILTAEQEKHLARQYQQGRRADELLKSDENLDKQTAEELETMVREGLIAKETFLRCNQRLVAKHAYYYIQYAEHQDLEDMIQEGNLGLIRALEKFDPERGWKFSTYATPWIQRNMQQSLHQKENAIRFGSQISVEMSSLKKAEELFYATQGRLPSEDELAEVSGHPIHKVRELKSFQVFGGIASLQQTLPGETALQLADLIVDDTVEVENEAINRLDRTSSELIMELMERANLTEREVAIIAMRFGFHETDTEPLSYTDIARTFGVTDRRASMVFHGALKKIREVVKNKDFEQEIAKKAS